MQMTKKITLLILSALAAVCVACAAAFAFSFTASADESTDHGGHSLADSWNELSSNNLAINGYTGATYYLSNDLNLSADSSETNITISGNVTLCLNGHTITGNGNGSVITVNSGATFTLCDCSSDESGTITGGYVNEGGGVYVSAGGTFIMEGGTITGNTALYGGGVYVAAYANIGETLTYGYFTMTGGSISDNNVVTSSDGAGQTEGGQGGGIYSRGNISLEGGIVSENNAITSGGGIYCNSGTVVTKNNFILYNNTINNTSSGNTTNGSGMYVSDSVTEGNIVFQGGFILDDVVTNSTDSLSIQGGYYRRSNVQTSSTNDAESTVFGKNVGDSYRVIYNESLLADSDDPYFNTVSADIQSQVEYFVYAVGQTTFSTDPKTYDGTAASTSDITVTVNRGGSIDETASYTLSEGFYTRDSSGDYSQTSAPTDAGVYYVYVQLNSTYTDYANQKYYTASGSYVSYTIEKAILTDITESAVSVEYDGEAHGVEIKFDGIVDGETFEGLLESEYATIEYSQTGGTEASDWTENPTFATTVTNCADGSLTIYYRVTFVNYKSENSDTFNGSFTITITPAEVTDSVLAPPSTNLYYHSTVPDISDTDWTWSSGVSVGATIDYGEGVTYAATYTVSGNKATNYDWTTWASENGITIENNGDDGITLVYTFAVTHNFTESDHTASKDATCTEGGTKEYWFCSNCGRYFSDEAGTIEIDGNDLETDPLGHDYEYDIVKPTESDNGSLTVTCSRCEKVKDTYILPVLGNSNYDVETVEATCTEGGSVTYSYYINETYGTIVVETIETDPLGHDYVKTVTSAPTEGAAGILKVTCSRCEDFNETVNLENLTDGNYKTELVEATCTEDGSITYCYVDEIYGEVEVATETIEALGHDFSGEDGYHEATEATYDEDGNIEYWHCQRQGCNKYFTMDDEGTLTETTLETVTIAKLTHTTEIVLLSVGGALCVGLAAILIWQIAKKRRVA